MTTRFPNTETRFYDHNARLRIISREELDQVKAMKIDRKLKSAKRLTEATKQGLIKQYRAWMHANNRVMPSERTILSFEKLTRAEQIDLIIRLKAKARKARRASLQKKQLTQLMKCK